MIIHTGFFCLISVCSKLNLIDMDQRSDFDASTAAKYGTTHRSAMWAEPSRRPPEGLGPVSARGKGAPRDPDPVRPGK